MEGTEGTETNQSVTSEQPSPSRSKSRGNRNTQPQASSDMDPVEFLRSSWKFAAVAQFLRTFQSTLKLDDFETEVITALSYNHYVFDY